MQLQDVYDAMNAGETRPFRCKVGMNWHWIQANGDDEVFFGTGTKHTVPKNLVNRADSSNLLFHRRRVDGLYRGNNSWELVGDPNHLINMELAHKAIGTLQSLGVSRDEIAAALRS